MIKVIFTAQKSTMAVLCCSFCKLCCFQAKAAGVLFRFLSKGHPTDLLSQQLWSRVCCLRCVLENGAIQSQSELGKEVGSENVEQKDQGR